jgi:hypothetical protein
MSENQARDSHGRFAGGAEGAARNNGSYPVAAHNGQASVGTHVAATSKGLTNAAQERQAILAGVDARAGTRNILRGLGAASPAMQRTYGRKVRS